jgi:hypothetical protein
MSANYKACAIIGVRIEKKKLYRTITVPGCSCLPVHGAKFCPECGKPALKSIEEPMVGFDPTGEDSKDFEPRFFGKTFVTEGTNSEYIYVGYFVDSESSQTSSRAAMAAVDYSTVSESRKALMALLAPHGLWDESAFGMWAVLYCSY